MSISHSFKAALVGAAVAALASPAAFAANQTQTWTNVQPSVLAPQGGVFSLNQFNPALGTLLQVDLNWELAASINAQISHNGDAGSAYVDGADIKYTFNAPMVSITALNEPIHAFAWLDGATSPIVIAPSGSALVGSGQQVNSANWAPYTGTGTFNVSWSIEEQDSGPGPVWVGDGGFQGAVLDGRLGGSSFSVSYIYAPIPEPGTYAMMALGLLAVVGYQARRKGTKA